MACGCWQGYTRLRKHAASDSGAAALRNNEHAHLRNSTSTDYSLSRRDPLYAWIDEGDHSGEMDKIISIRRSLTPEESEQLASEPIHINHDLMLCRFLRGHQNKVPSAVKAVRDHLKLRRNHRSFLDQILASVPADREDFSGDLSPLAERFRKLKMLQLPGRYGTNDGMPLSLIALGRFKVQDLIAFDDEELSLWVLSLVEIRCLCLHNQSMREQRMVRVVEVRDCTGVDWMQFLTAPGMLRKLPRLLEIAMVYPELVGSALMFNMNPGSMFTFAIRNMAPKNVRGKVLFANRGNWEECICVKRGLSLEAVIRWTRYLQDFRVGTYRQTLTPNESQGVRAIAVSAGEMFSWRVRCKLGSELVRKSYPLICISVHFFAKSRETPTHEMLYNVTENHNMDVVCNGTLQKSVDGVALLEIELKGRRALEVSALLVLGSSDAVDSLEQEVVLSHVAEIPSGCDTSQSHCHESWLLGKHLLLAMCLLLLFLARRSLWNLFAPLQLS